MSGHILDWPNLVAGFVLGMGGALLWDLIKSKVVKFRLRRKFEKYNGNYLGYHPKGEGSWEIDPDPKSKAEINYLGDMNIRIQVSHHNLAWIGIIKMETDESGSIAWRYYGLSDGQYQYGFKRCILEETGNEFKIFLVGEKAEGYGRELLIKKKL